MCIRDSDTTSLEGNSESIPVRDFEWCVGVHHDQGIRFTMEDAESIVTGIKATELGRNVDSQPRACPQLAFFGVYDGHGGSEAAEFCRSHLASTVLQAVKARLDRESATDTGDESCSKEADLNAHVDEKSIKDAICLANNLKKLTSDDQWDMLVKVNTGEMDESDMSMEQAMGMMAPTVAAAKECGVKLFE